LEIQKGKDHAEDLGVYGVCGNDLTGVRWQVLDWMQDRDKWGSCENDNELSGTTKEGESLE